MHFSSKLRFSLLFELFGRILEETSSLPQLAHLNRKMAGEEHFVAVTFLTSS